MLENGMKSSKVTLLVKKGKPENVEFFYLFLSLC